MNVFKKLQSYVKFSLLVYLLFFSYFLEASTLYPFSDTKQMAQFQHLIADLRCPVCQNQNIADSNAPLAKTLRQDVYRSILAGQSDDEIIHDMTARYGDYIVFNPPVKALTWLLWFGPVIFLLSGVLIFYVACIKKPKRTPI